jgi:hypothetical protein
MTFNAYYCKYTWIFMPWASSKIFHEYSWPE